MLERETPRSMTKEEQQFYRKINQNEIKQATTATFLPLTWKLLTDIIADEICVFLENERILPEKQKGCRRDSKGTGTSYR